MKKFFFVFFIITTVFTFASNNIAFSANAAVDAVNSTAGNEPQQTSIELPYGNIINIPVLNYKLIYVEKQASLVDFLEKDIKDFKNQLSTYGVSFTNTVIIFLDHEGYKPASPINADTNNKYLSETVTKTTDMGNTYTTDEKIKLSIKKLSPLYSLPFLTIKRRVLIGTLIPDSNPFKGNDKVKVVPFNQPDIKGFQYVPSSYYAPVFNTENSSKNQNNNIAPPGNTKFNFNQDKNKSENVKLNYSKEDIILQRASMIQYLNLGIFSNTPLIGMVELFDEGSKVYTYLALTGDTDEFLATNK